MYVTNQEAIDDRTMRIERGDVVGSGFIQFPPQKPFSEKIEVQPPTVSHEALPEMYNGRAGHVQPTRQAGQGAYAPRPAGPGSYAPRPAATSARPAMQQLSTTSQTSFRPASGVRGAQSGPAGGYAPAPAQPGRGTGPRGNGYAPAGSAYPSGGHSTGRSNASGRGAPVSSGRGGRGAQGRPSSQNVARQSGAGEAAVQHRSSSAGAAMAPAAAAHVATGRGRGGGGYAQQRPVPDRQLAQPPAAAVRPVATGPPPERQPAPVAAPPPRPPSSDTDDGEAGMTRSQLKRLRKKKRDGKA